ncbi:MAG: UDP-N-acetylmuramoyl-L-alanine--D-glutamate ligase [Deltaproteobacteria bacterium]|nr:UDP-N-acetylmuramoyl-L-alanine--D-glutamate ligase [Deltaproteobacteria bacterium]
MNLLGKRILVVGLARSGIAAARFCAARGAKVTVTDAARAEKLAKAIAKLDGCATLEIGGHRPETFTNSDLIVMSPGVPELPETTAARQAGVEVIAEIELAYRFLHREAVLIAITGTNGKSTTTSLAGAICAESGVPTFCGGNLGNPLIEAVDTLANSKGGYVVAEVAGFQLETCAGFRPKVAAGLNITEDHLDRFGTMDFYAEMKNRVFRWQGPEDHAIANALDPRVVAGARGSNARTWFFSSAGEVNAGAFLSSDRAEVILRLGDGEERYPTSDLVIVGTHNLENAMAAYLATRLSGVPPEAVRMAARAFRPLPHRMELVGEKDGVHFYDDSKGTNVGAVAAALDGFPARVVLIAGGKDKGGDYTPMIQALKKCARAVVLIGEATPIIEKAFTEARVSFPSVRAGDMHDAVRTAFSLAHVDDAVVLSPACSSYDMFDNFEHRGLVFRDAVAVIGARRLDTPRAGS